MKIINNSSKIIFAILSLTSLLLAGCGIYTVNTVLNSPFNISITGEYLSFYGNNQEESFIGYNIWYKENESDIYKLCYYKTGGNYYIKPTLPKSIVNYSGKNSNIIYFNNLYPQELDLSFYDLSQEGKSFYFAISAYGLNGEESEKVEYGIWPK